MKYARTQADASAVHFLERRSTPIGRMVIVTDEQRLLRLVDWEDHEARMHRLMQLQYGQRLKLEEAPGASAAHAGLEAYFGGDIHALAGLPSEANGTAFQQRVWARLSLIPAGTTITYGRLAIDIGQPAATRAVGLANGANPVNIVVPCHRVVGANSSLTGYGSGIERKRWLLRHEGASLPALL